MRMLGPHTGRNSLKSVNPASIGKEIRGAKAN